MPGGCSRRRLPPNCIGLGTAKQTRAWSRPGARPGRVRRRLSCPGTAAKTPRAWSRPNRPRVRSGPGLRARPRPTSPPSTSGSGVARQTERSRPIARTAALSERLLSFSRQWTWMSASSMHEPSSLSVCHSLFVKEASERSGSGLTKGGLDHGPRGLSANLRRPLCGWWGASRPVVDSASRGRLRPRRATARRSPLPPPAAPAGRQREPDGGRDRGVVAPPPRSAGRGDRAPPAGSRRAWRDLGAGP
jgi:hypothetical protein